MIPFSSRRILWKGEKGGIFEELSSYHERLWLGILPEDRQKTCRQQSDPVQIYPGRRGLLQITLSLIIKSTVSITSAPVSGIGSKKDFKETRQLCAGYMNPERKLPKKLFFEFNNKRKRKFREIDPFPYDIDIEVRFN